MLGVSQNQWSLENQAWSYASRIMFHYVLQNWPNEKTAVIAAAPKLHATVYIHYFQESIIIITAIFRVNATCGLWMWLWPLLLPLSHLLVSRLRGGWGIGMTALITTFGMQDHRVGYSSNGRSVFRRCGQGENMTIPTTPSVWGMHLHFCGQEFSLHSGLLTVRGDTVTASSRWQKWGHRQVGLPGTNHKQKTQVSGGSDERTWGLQWQCRVFSVCVSRQIWWDFWSFWLVLCLWLQDARLGEQTSKSVSFLELFDAKCWVVA